MSSEHLFYRNLLCEALLHDEARWRYKARMRSKILQRVLQCDLLLIVLPLRLGLLHDPGPVLDGGVRGLRRCPRRQRRGLPDRPRRAEVVLSSLHVNVTRSGTSQ